MSKPHWIPVEGHMGRKLIWSEHITTISMKSSGHRDDDSSHCIIATMSDGSEAKLFTGSDIQAKAALETYTNHHGGVCTFPSRLARLK